MSIRNIRIVISLLILCKILSAQSLDDLTFGTDSTFDILTWNIEWFPKNDQITITNVTKIIKALDVDVLALQEISDTTLFKEMVDAIDGYQWYFDRGWYGGLAYIYKTSDIEILNFYKILDAEIYWSPFPRSPFVLELKFMNEKYIVINNHFKCCGDGVIDRSKNNDEETRRYLASNLLKQYIDLNFQGEKVIVLGDLNDVLTDESINNVFQKILDDTENYKFADLNIAKGTNSNWSFPGWPSHIDHILITDELFTEFEDEGSDIQTIKIDDYLAGGFWEYDQKVSDHRPVALKLKPGTSSAIEIEKSIKSSLINYPNPFNNVTNILFDGTIENAEIEIYNLVGNKVYAAEINRGQSLIKWDAKNLPNGIYTAKLISEDRVQAITKMVLLK